MSDIFNHAFPFLLMIGMSVFGLTESALIKQYNKKHSSGGFIFIAMVSLASMLFFLFKYIFTDVEKLDFTPNVIIYAVIAGIFYASASVLTFYALRYGPLAITGLILSFSIVFVSGYGIIFLEEPATPLTYVGFLGIAISLFLVRGKDDGDKKAVTLKWIVCTALSVVLAALYSIVLRMQQVEFNNTVTNECMIISLGTSAVITFIIGFITSGKDAFNILKTGAPYALIAGGANGINNMLHLILNTVMPVSINAPTSSIIKTIVTFGYSYIILKERFLPRQIIGIIVGTGAVILLNMS